MEKDNKKNLQIPTYNLYAHSYDEVNDLYLIRGLSSYEATFEPRVMHYIPRGLLNELKVEYTLNNKNEIYRERISYSTDHYYAVVDFNNREFSNDEIMQVVAGEKVEKKQKILSLFNKKKNSI